MKLIVTSLMFTAMLLCCLSVNAHAITLTAEDVKFLRGCNVEQADIDVIPNLPLGGQERLQLVLESSRKHCNMEAITSFKATREFLRKYTPEPTMVPLPPVGYSRAFLTPEELKYILDINNRLMNK